MEEQKKTILDNLIDYLKEISVMKNGRVRLKKCYELTLDINVLLHDTDKTSDDVLNELSRRVFDVGKKKFEVTHLMICHYDNFTKTDVIMNVIRTHAYDDTEIYNGI